LTVFISTRKQMNGFWTKSKQIHLFSSSRNYRKANGHSISIAEAKLS
jgi:hypothetical protein